jgi:hypothetical protein
LDHAPVFRENACSDNIYPFIAFIRIPIAYENCRPGRLFRCSIAGR